MSRATRLGDQNTGHDACPPVPLASGSPDVYINGRPAGRVGDPYSGHGCRIHPAHVGTISSGSATVYINGRKAGRVSDAVSCGGAVQEGSDDVMIGG